MLKSYFTIALRNLKKHPLNSFINIFGLAAAVGICIFTYAYARWVYSTDQFHENKHNVFLVTFAADRDGSLQHFGSTPRPLAEMLKQDFSQITHVCRVEDRSVVVKREDKVFHERVRFTDQAFLEMFTFPLKWGNAKSLGDLNSVILSDEMAVKYFGDNNPVGETITIKFDQDHGKDFKVAGVAKEFPKARTISFNFIVNIQNLKSANAGYDFEDWKSLLHASLVQTKTPSDIREIGANMDKYKKIQNEAVGEDWAISSFGFEAIATLHERSEAIRDDISRSSSSNFKSVMYLGIVSLMLMVLASLNYVNIAIVSASKRLKEIGVRKSAGATRRVVIIQFLSENLLITLCAIILGLLLAYVLFIPGFEHMFHFSMGFSFSDPALWIFLPLMLLFTSIASGIYPSFYISRFEVVNILKGKVKFGNKNPLTKTLLCFQLILACIFITSAVMFTQNTDYLSKRSWGYNPHELLYAVVPDRAGFEKLQALMIRESGVESLAGSQHHLGKNHEKAILHFADHQYEVEQLGVSSDYFETMGLSLKQGRGFHDHEGSDMRAVIVNEEFINRMEWDNAIGHVFRMDSIEYEVVGVVQDFHSYSFHKKIQPTIFTVAGKEYYRFLSLKAKDGAVLDVAKTLQARWSEVFPDIPFDGGHQEDVWGFYFQEIEIHSIVWRVFAIIAVTLATLGLYGLVSLNVAGRVREFSIRKLLGAKLADVGVLITRQYAILFFTALLVGVPLSYTLIKTLITYAYSYHMPITYSGVTIAAVILTITLAITVATQVRKVAKANPVEGLKE